MSEARKELAEAEAAFRAVQFCGLPHDQVQPIYEDWWRAKKAAERATKGKS